MNKEEILGMEAGEELDALVATQIMGWGSVHVPSQEFVYEGKIVWHDFNLDAYISEWYPSTDISAAWPIAVKMGLALFPLNNKDWCCCKASYVYHMEIGQDHYADPNLVICKEAPEAICKAALLAKETGGACKDD